MVRNLFIVPEQTTNENTTNNIKQYLIIDDNNSNNNNINNNKDNANSQLTHHVIEVPRLEDIKATINSSKRTQQSKEFCIRSGGYPDNNIKNDMYNFLLATSLYQHDLVKISQAEKEKLQMKKCVELKIERETMMTFGIL